MRKAMKRYQKKNKVQINIKAEKAQITKNIHIRVQYKKYVIY